MSEVPLHAGRDPATFRVGKTFSTSRAPEMASADLAFCALGTNCFQFHFGINQKLLYILRLATLKTRVDLERCRDGALDAGGYTISGIKSRLE